MEEGRLSHRAEVTPAIAPAVPEYKGEENPPKTKIEIGGIDKLSMLRTTTDVDGYDLRVRKSVVRLMFWLLVTIKTVSHLCSLWSPRGMLKWSSSS